MTPKAALIESTLAKLGCMPRRGSDGFVSRCPAHSDESPSFSIRDDGVYICFSGACGVRGNLHSFLRQFARLSPNQIAATIRDLPLPPRSSRGALQVRSYDERRAPAAPKGVPETLAYAYGALCPKYLLQRGFTKDTLKHFGVGFDRQSREVVIPLRYPTGHLAGFVRRQVGAAATGPRYRIDVPGQGRGTLLFNYHRAQTMSSPTHLVEGALDAMWLHQAGIHNVVALLGTTFSRAQRDLLVRAFDQFTLMFDNDAAGRACTHNVYGRLRGAGRIFVAAPFVSGKDAQDNTPAQLAQVLLGKTPGATWVRGHPLALKGQ